MHAYQTNSNVKVIVAVMATIGVAVCNTTAKSAVQPAIEGDSGFVSMFDGETLDGWHAVPIESASDWSVHNGAIVGHGSADRLSYLVWKDERLTDFELQLRYRVPDKGNTGVEIRSQRDVTGKRPFEGYHADLGHVGIGPHILGAWDFHFARRKEYPCPRGTRLVIDEDGESHASTIRGALTADDVRRHRWNDVRIIARGKRFQFFINDKLTSEFTDASKWGRLDHGAVGLQIHNKGMRVEFKDLRLRRLAPTGDNRVESRKSRAESPLQRTKYLLLDSRVVESARNARLTVGTVRKHRNNPLFAEDKPWEPRFDNLYANVLYDEDENLYKCWYSPFIIDESTTNTPKEDRVNGGQFKYQGKHTGRRREMGICYAVSRDGIKWEKPNLGVVEFKGSTENNIVWRGPHGSGIFKDPRDPDPKRRYKAFFKGKMISVGFSPDGIHWNDTRECPEANVRGDTHNNAFWAPTLGEYVGITRTWAKPRGRQVARTSSKDFLKWTRAEVVLEGVEDHLQTYAMPVFYYAGVYMGLPAIYDSDADRTHTELAWSPDTLVWHRIDPGTPLIANGAEKGQYDWGTVYAAAYPVFLKDEIRLYYGGCDDEHFGWRNGYFCLATLRPDGFAGYEPISPEAPAVIVTQPILSTGHPLALSADVRKGGSLAATLFDADGNTLAQSEPLKKNATDTRLQWPGTFKSTVLKGKTIYLEFRLKNAKLYSFTFQR